MVFFICPEPLQFWGHSLVHVVMAKYAWMKSKSDHA